MVARDWRFQADEAKEALPQRNSYLEFLRAACTPESDYDGAIIIFTELVANVIRHTSGPIQICVRGNARGTVTLRVSDFGSPFPLSPSLPPTTSEGGRGLYIIAQLSSDVSVSRNEYGNVVRVDLPVALTSSLLSAASSDEDG
jgi:anti-sigma regulatory factor (Ser/Thr protein kinase)